MMQAILVLALLAVAAAFLPTQVQRSTRTELAMKVNDFQKAFASTVIGASLFLGGVANAEINYEGIKYLGGGDKIDLNNANVRAYLKLPGVYPTLAGKIVTNGPFKTVTDVENIPGLSSVEKDLLKKYESKFVVLDVKPEYALDKYNNGLYK